MKRREPVDIRLLRLCLRHWPFAHGRFLFIRLIKPWLRRREPVMFECEPGVFVSGSLDDWVVLWSFIGEHARDPAFQLSLSLLRRGGVALDVGANIGIWTLCAARRVGASLVHAFEPVPQLYEALVRHAATNGFPDVLCRRLALSNRCGTATFFVATHGNSGGSGLASRPGIEQPIEVEMVTLDKYCEEHGLDELDFVKIDVEGAEALVISGGRRLLSGDKAPVIMFESQAGNAALFGRTQSDVREQLEALGYTIFRFDGRSLIPVKSDRLNEDLFALKPNHFARDHRLRALLRN